MHLELIFRQFPADCTAHLGGQFSPVQTASNQAPNLLRWMRVSGCQSASLPSERVSSDRELRF